MNVTQIRDPAKFLAELGGLHDAHIETVSYHLDDRRLELEIADVSWNRSGKDDLAPQPCTLIFSDVSSFSVSAGQDKFHTSISATERAHVSSAYAITKNDLCRFDVLFTTSERWFVEFSVLEVRVEIPLS